MLPFTSTATQNVGVGQETEIVLPVGATGSRLPYSHFADAPAPGSVEMAAAPSPLVATHKCADGHEMPESPREDVNVGV